MTTAREPRATSSSGLFAVFRAIGQLARLPRAWPYAAVPVLLFALLASLGAWGAFRWLEPLVKGLFPAATSWYGQLGEGLASHLAALLGAFAAALLALVLTPTLSAPALERIVAIVEADLGAPRRAPIGWLAELVCGLRALAAGAMFALPIAIVLFFVDLSFPPAALATVPLRAVTAALMVAWSLIDYPLTLRGMRVRERLALVRREWRSFLGFGLGFAAVFWLPCCGVVLLPLGVVAATRLVSTWLD